ncbi:tetratricopeptide repeat protein [Candidatus Villigracilis vicinus]|uniref:tetratricopeptide repeat protein n=1 Tax=Candidatus Villigracilis vicinus TaxID=3140679 RepID=UPI0031E5D865
MFKAQGDYATALDYLKQSLTIQQQIGDSAGLCVTLFNMGFVYIQNEQQQEAYSTWVNSYLIAKKINYYQVLEALKNLAPQLGLSEGLAGWEDLANRMQKAE